MSTLTCDTWRAEDRLYRLIVLLVVQGSNTPILKLHQIPGFILERV
jgi:hypothetical protein